MNQHDRIMAPWAIYDPKGHLAWLGLEATRMFAWTAYGKVTSTVFSYGEIMRREQEGWTVKRVEVRPLQTVVTGLRQGGKVPTAEKFGEFSEDNV